MTTDDLIVSLREHSEHPDGQLYQQAADEIARLREALRAASDWLLEGQPSRALRAVLLALNEGEQP
jgi:hypothetical protein